MRKWYKSVGAEGDIVVSTRVRLARNLRDFPFPCRMNQEQQKRAAALIKVAAKGSEQELGRPFDYLDMNEIPRLRALSMVERHLISPEFVENGQNRALLLTRDEAVSIMICEEDHIRIQVMREGLCLDEAYRLAEQADDLISRKLDVAFDQTLGYLTQCPTNLGTGMRASVMLHLPAITRLNGMPQVMRNVSKIGLTIRGLYGEGSEPAGEFYQLSNQVTLGISEQTALDNLTDITRQLITEERRLRTKLLQNDSVTDHIFRSLGVLKYARRLTGQECTGLLSNVRLGVAQGLIKEIGLEQISGLLIDLQPATLSDNEELTPEQRDRKRADMVRKTLKEEKV